MVLDPYTKAAVSSKGSGVVVQDMFSEKAANDGFITPDPKYLRILEAHLRDLLAKAPEELSFKDMLNFSGKTKHLENRNCYLHQVPMQTNHQVLRKYKILEI
jgi:hypothetical protein